MIDAGKKYVVCGNCMEKDRGKIVTVFGLLFEKGEKYKIKDNFHSVAEENRWLIDKTISQRYGIGVLKVCHAPESLLKPLDDDSRKVASWKNIAHIWKPEGLGELV